MRKLNSLSANLYNNSRKLTKLGGNLSSCGKIQVD